MLNWTDRVLIRWINRLILLHLLICVGSIGGIGLSLVSTWKFIQAVRLPSALISHGETASLPLIERERERWDARSSRWLCYLGDGFLAQPYHRSENPSALESVRVYRHPQLEHTPGSIQKIVEVPENPTWGTVFEAAEGRSVFSYCLRFLGIWLATIVAVYIAIRGYWLIKHGPKRGSYRPRR